MGKIARSGALVVSLTLASALAPVLGTPAHADIVRDREWGLRAMHAPQAWKYSKGNGVTVAVLDTGVYPGAPDIAGRVTTGPDYTNSGRHKGSAYWGRHGTAMAGIIAGHGHGAGASDGVMGIAPGARILSIRVTLEASDPLRGNRAVLNRTRYALANGIRYAADHGAKVISMSLGGGTAYYDGSQTERAAIAYAIRKGAVLVASAGNDGAHGNRRTFPAAYTGVVAVGAVGKKLNRAPFSNDQGYVKVLAPGVNIVTAGGRHGYASTTGTSASTAFAAGTAALIRARYHRMSGKLVAQALRQGTGRGDTLDARRALFAAAKLKRASGGGTTPTPMASDHPAPPAKAKSSQTLLYAGIGGGALVLAIIAALIVVLARRRRRAEAAQAEVNADRVNRSRRPDLGEVPPVSARGRMPERRSGSHLAAFTAAGPGGASPNGNGATYPNGNGAPYPNGNGNGHGRIQELHPYLPASPPPPDPGGPRLNPYSDVHPAAQTESFGAVDTGPAAPPETPPDGLAQTPHETDSGPRPPHEPGASGPQAPFSTGGSGPQPPYEPGPASPTAYEPGSGPQGPYPPGGSEAEAYAPGSGPQGPYAPGDSGPQVPYEPGGSGPQGAYDAGGSGPRAAYGFPGDGGELGRQMAPPPPLPPEPGEAAPPAPPARPGPHTEAPPAPEPRGHTAPMPAPPAATEAPRPDPLPPLPPSGASAPPPPPTVETPEPPRTSPPAYGGDTPLRPYQSTGSVWDTPKLWQGADTSATAPFEAEARSDKPRRPTTERGTTGWATAAGWDATPRPSDAATPTDGDDEDDRHL